MPQDDWLQETDEELYDDLPEEDELNLTVPCPSCRAEVYEDSPRCPSCGSYITHDRSPWTGRPIWWIVLAVVGMAATLAVLAGVAP